MNGVHTYMCLYARESTCPYTTLYGRYIYKLCTYYGRKIALGMQYFGDSIVSKHLLMVLYLSSSCKVVTYKKYSSNNNNNKNSNDNNNNNIG